MADIIHYCGIESPLGSLLLAASGSGLCAVRLPGENKPEALESMKAFLEQRFPGLELVSVSTGLSQAVSYLEDYFNGPMNSRPYEGKTDPGGTSFQREVWGRMARIPAGSVLTYGELAKSIGHPGASRAVGAACSVNPLAIVFPCHRVIGARGKLTGFGGGLRMKEKLLADEGWVNPWGHGR